jgi:hypothetical protein
MKRIRILTGRHVGSSLDLASAETEAEMGAAHEVDLSSAAVGME